MSFTALVLFDIDGTLIRRAGHHHRAALVHGVRLVTGLETTTEGIPVQGMLDPDIIAAMLRNAGAPRALYQRSVLDIQRAAENFYLRACPPLHDKHCPAVEPTLKKLERNGALLALVTGNLTRIGWRKLDRAGLKGYFHFGAFGEMAKTRGGLAKWAIAEARRKHMIPRHTPISLVGDATSDVIAAQQNRIPIISVETGITPREELVALAPDYLLRNLRELRLHMLGLGNEKPVAATRPRSPSA